MACLISKAGAWSNGEVAYLYWSIKSKIDGCLGFMVTRVHETGQDAGARRVLPSWISFTDQSNPDWIEQDTSVWPIQNFEWRDLTLRRSRDTTNVRPIDFRVHYEIVPVGSAAADRKPVPPSTTAIYANPDGSPRYVGTPRPLFVIGDPIVTDPFDVTHDFSDSGAKIRVAFTNGILSTQNLLQQLRSAIEEKGGKEPLPNTTSGLLAELKKQIVDPKSKIRAFLTADVLSFVRSLVDRTRTDGGDIYLALYELHDPELIGLLEAEIGDGHIHIILSTAGNTDPNAKNPPKKDRKPVVWDTENNDARAALHRAAPNAIQDRMFNNSVAIGHDKFAVYVKDNTPVAVMTGSTNWTETGLCTQSNNCIIIEQPDVARYYYDFWHRLAADKQPARVPLKETDSKGHTIVGAEKNSANQGQILRTSNMKGFGPTKAADGNSQFGVWFSPNTKTNRRTDTSPMPGDLSVVYNLMNSAKKAIIFLTFMPGESGKQNIIGEAAKLAVARPDLLVLGAISDPAAMPNYARPPKGAPKTPGEHIPAVSVWWIGDDRSNIAMVRATAISTPMGDLHPELLSAGHAIIHDKIIVIDPLDEVNCTVITGSHNLGYKASYANDENLLFIRGNRRLAASYAVHVIDVYQHYLMRAKQEEAIRDALLAGKPPPQNTTDHGFLQTTDVWQDRKLAKQPQSIRDYFLSALP